MEFNNVIFENPLDNHGVRTQLQTKIDFFNQQSGLKSHKRTQSLNKRQNFLETQLKISRLTDKQRAIRFQSLIKKNLEYNKVFNQSSLNENINRMKFIMENENHFGITSNTRKLQIQQVDRKINFEETYEEKLSKVNKKQMNSTLNEFANHQQLNQETIQQGYRRKRERIDNNLINQKNYQTNILLSEKYENFLNQKNKQLSYAFEYNNIIQIQQSYLSLIFKVFLSLIRLSIIIDDPFIMLTWIHTLAQIMFDLNNIDLAFYYLNEAFQISFSLDGFPLMIEILIGLGTCAIEIYDYELAKQFFKKSLQFNWYKQDNIKNKMKFEEDLQSLEIDIYEWLGIICLYTNEMENCIIYHDKALNYKIEQQNTPLRNLSNSNLKENVKYCYNLTKANKLLLQQMSLPLKINDSEIGMQNLILSLQELEQFSKIIKDDDNVQYYNSKAKLIVKKFKDPLFKIMNYQILTPKKTVDIKFDPNYCNNDILNQIQQNRIKLNDKSKDKISDLYNIKKFKVVDQFNKVLEKINFNYKKQINLRLSFNKKFSDEDNLKRVQNNMKIQKSNNYGEQRVMNRTFLNHLEINRLSHTKQERVLNHKVKFQSKISDLILEMKIKVKLIK